MYIGKSLCVVLCVVLKPMINLVNVYVYTEQLTKNYSLRTIFMLEFISKVIAHALIILLVIYTKVHSIDSNRSTVQKISL